MRVEIKSDSIPTTDKVIKMPRAQVYIKQNNYKIIQSIVDAKKEEGARTETNVSSVAAMLLDIGLRVYKLQQKKDQEEDTRMNGNNEISDMMEFNKILIENAIKKTYASTLLLQMVDTIKDVKEIEFFSYNNLKNDIKNKSEKKIKEMFSEGECL